MTNPRSAGNVVFTIAAVVVIVAGMRAAKSLLVPFLLACFLAVLLTPIMRWMQRRGMPLLLALLVVLLATLSVGFVFVWLVGASVRDFYGDLPRYQAQLHEQLDRHRQRLESIGIEIPPMPEVPADPTESAADIEQELEESAQRLRLDAQAGLQFVKSLLGELTGVASSAVVIIVTVILMLLEAARFPEKLNVILAPDSPARLHVAVILVNIRRYMGIKTATSLLTGALVAGFLWIVGVEDPLLWGLLAFLFNYIPNIGSILAAVPAVLLAFMQFGLPAAVVTAIGYMVINCLISYAIEPRFMGQGLGLSTLVVFVSLVFWGWVLGPMGMLLSAPLTMIAKIIMNNYEDTRWLAVLISARAPEGEKL